MLLGYLPRSWAFDCHVNTENLCQFLESDHSSSNQSKAPAENNTNVEIRQWEIIPYAGYCVENRSKSPTSLPRDTYSHTEEAPMPFSLSEHEFARLNTYIYLCDFGRFPHRKGKARENRTCAVLDLIGLRRDIAAPLNHTWFSVFSAGEPIQLPLVTS